MGVQRLMVEVERVVDAFHNAAFTTGDIDAAMALVSPDGGLACLPVGVGAAGTEAMRRLLAEDLVPHLPADLAFRRLSRTGDRWRVAQEDMVTFTHDRELPWLLPGVPATHRTAEVLAVSVVTVRRSLITSHRTLWDHAGLLSQLEIDTADVRLPQPVAG